MRHPCLSEVALMRMHAGLGSPPQSAHVARCERCTAHYRRLIGDLEIITGIVMDTAIAPTARIRLRHAWGWRRPALASAMAASLVIALTVRSPVRQSPVTAPHAMPEVPSAPAVLLSTDPDALVAVSPGSEGGCGSSDDDVAAVACHDDDSASTDSVGTLEVG